MILCYVRLQIETDPVFLNILKPTWHYYAPYVTSLHQQQCTESYSKLIDMMNYFYENSKLIKVSLITYLNNSKNLVRKKLRSLLHVKVHIPLEKIF